MKKSKYISSLHSSLAKLLQPCNKVLQVDPRNSYYSAAAAAAVTLLKSNSSMAFVTGQAWIFLAKAAGGGALASLTDIINAAEDNRIMRNCRIFVILCLCNPPDFLSRRRMRLE